MNYRLVVLTHGASEPLALTLAAFAEHVTPLPTDVDIIVDGPTAALRDRLHPVMTPMSPEFVANVAVLPVPSGPAGFCAATRYAWSVAGHAYADYVFWLEHDFIITRPVDLAQLAAVLDHEPMLAQMALMRGAVNETEKAAGGLFESRPGQYEPRTLLSHASLAPPLGWTTGGVHRWLEHRAYLTTNPSLMRRDFMRANPWPAEHESECEGRFGIELVAAGYTFGAWGDGTPWCEHVGRRTGFGY